MEKCTVTTSKQKKHTGPLLLTRHTPHNGFGGQNLTPGHTQPPQLATTQVCRRRAPGQKPYPFSPCNPNVTQGEKGVKVPGVRSALPRSALPSLCPRGRRQKGDGGRVTSRGAPASLPGRSRRVVPCQRDAGTAVGPPRARTVLGKGGSRRRPRTKPPAPSLPAAARGDAACPHPPARPNRRALPSPLASAALSLSTSLPGRSEMEPGEAWGLARRAAPRARKPRPPLRRTPRDAGTALPPSAAPRGRPRSPPPRSPPRRGQKDAALTTRAGLPAAASGPLSCGTRGRPQRPPPPAPAGSGLPPPPPPTAPLLPPPPPLQQRPSCASAASLRAAARPFLRPAPGRRRERRNRQKQPSHGPGPAGRRAAGRGSCYPRQLRPGQRTAFCLPCLWFLVGFFFFSFVLSLHFLVPSAHAAVAMLRDRGFGSSLCSVRAEELGLLGAPQASARHFTSGGARCGPARNPRGAGLTVWVFFLKTK